MTAQRLSHEADDRQICSRRGAAAQRVLKVKRKLKTLNWALQVPGPKSQVFSFCG